MTCTRCEKTLSGRLDTYGPVHTPLCQACWLAYREPVTIIVHTLELDDQGNIIAEGIRVERNNDEETEVRK
jgi:hypothetical protein